MELQERLSDFATAVGAKIKEVEANSGGGSGVQNVFIQETEPEVSSDSLWIQRLPNGNLTMWLKGV